MMMRIMTASWRLNMIESRTHCIPLLHPGKGVVLKSAGKAVKPQLRIRRIGDAGTALPPAQPALSALETGSLHPRDRKTCLATAAPREALKAEADRRRRERGVCQWQGKKQSSSQPAQQRRTSCLHARWDTFFFSATFSAWEVPVLRYHPHDLDLHTCRTSFRNKLSGTILEKPFSFSQVGFYESIRFISFIELP